MKEFKYIIHAFLLLLASIVVFICLKTLFTSQINQPSELVRIDYKSVPDPPSKGELLFKANCASCHIIGRNFTGPSLCGFEDREPWTERENIYKWIKNPAEFMKNSEYLQDLKQSYSGRMMMAFPNLTNEEIDEIVMYINSACAPEVVDIVAKN